MIALCCNKINTGMFNHVKNLQYCLDSNPNRSSFSSFSKYRVEKPHILKYFKLVFHTTHSSNNKDKNSKFQ